jgi:hypothetical protein
MQPRVSLGSLNTIIDQPYEKTFIPALVNPDWVLRT